MPSFEITIWGFKHNEPHPTKCIRKTCYLDHCQDIEVPCGSKGTQLYEVVVGITIPDVNKETNLIILQCANEVAYVVSGIVSDTIASCAVINDLCVKKIQDSLVSTNKEAVETFEECLSQSGVSEEIKQACEVKVYIRENYI